MADLNIQLVGEWKIHFNNVLLPSLRAHRTRSLLSYLLLYHDQAISKALLAEQFWPNSTVKQARSNLRRELFSLRRWHPIINELLEDQNGFMQWRMPASYRIDIQEYRSLFDKGHACWNETVAVKLAEFEPDGILRNISEEWAHRQQQDLIERYIASIRELLATDLPNKQSSAIYESLFAKLIDLDSLNEENYALLIRYHLDSKNKERALYVWHRCKSVLRQELGVSPGASLQQLYNTELQRYDNTRRSSDGAVECPKELIGRERHWSELTSITFQNYPRLILIEGVPGIGKTRLAEEFIRYCKARGDGAVKARAMAGGSGAPFAPVSEWFSSSEIRESVKLIDERKQSLVYFMFPEVCLSIAGGEPAIPNRFRRERLFSALSQTIKQVGKPFVLFMDDIQWCDDDTLSWLSHLLNRAAPERLLVLATRRTRSESSNALNALVYSAERQNRLTVIGLDELSAESARTLACDLLRKENAAACVENLNILDAAAGNPFYIIEITRAIAARHRQSPTENNSVHSSGELYDIIRRRLEALSDDALDGLRLLSVLRRPFTDVEFCHFCDMDSRNAALTLTSLIESHVVISDADYQYRLVHDCITEAFYSELSTPLCRHYHEKIARASQWADARVTLDAGELAHHLHHAGRISEAVDWYLGASQEATNRLSSRTAIRYLDMALDLLRSVESEGAYDQRVVELLIQKLLCQQTIYGFFSEEIIETCELLESQLPEISDSELRVRILTLLRSVYGNTNLTRALKIDEECMTLAKNHNNPKMAITTRRSMGFTQFLMGNYADASKTLGKAYKIYRKTFSQSTAEQRRDHVDNVIMLAILAVVNWIRGKPETVHSTLKTIRSFHYELVPAQRQFFARQFLWQICFFCRDVEGLRGHHAWYLRAAETEPNTLIEDHAIWVGGAVAWVNKDYSEAAKQFKRSLKKTDRHTLFLQAQRRVQLAEVEMLHGDRVQASKYLTLAKQSARKTRQTFWESERFRVAALLAEAESVKPKEVLWYYAKAIETAKRQHAVYFEIKARRERMQYHLRTGNPIQARAEGSRLINKYGVMRDYPEIGDLHRMHQLNA